MGALRIRRNAGGGRDPKSDGDGVKLQRVCDDRGVTTNGVFVRLEDAYIAYTDETDSEWARKHELQLEKLEFKISPHRNLAFAAGFCYPIAMSYRETYEAVEAEIHAARERRAANKRRRAAARARAFGDLCEASEGRAVVWRREGTPLAEIVAFADGDVWLLQTLVRWLRLSATQRIARLKHAANRPAYYARERARRQALAAARRSTARRTTENPCPTKEQILEAWTKAKDSNEDLIRFGSLIEDLACYVDSSLVRDESGEIVGRRGGVKAWLQENIPALYLRYTTVMQYKQAAKRLRQVVGLVDPIPAARVVAAEPPADERLEVVRARAVYREVMGGDPPRSRTAFMVRIGAYLDPDNVTEATTLSRWREAYAREITVRTKKKWIRRFWRPTG